MNWTDESGVSPISTANFTQSMERLSRSSSHLSSPQKPFLRGYLKLPPFNPFQTALPSHADLKANNRFHFSFSLSSFRSVFFFFLSTWGKVLCKNTFIFNGFFNEFFSWPINTGINYVTAGSERRERFNPVLETYAASSSNAGQHAHTHTHKPAHAHIRESLVVYNHSWLCT